MKKAIAVVFCIMLLLGTLFVEAAAQEQSQPFSMQETVMQQAHDSYYRSRATAGKRSFHGSCGLMVSHQLYNLGINKQCIIFDGNDQYDYYSGREVTTGGYYIKSYPSEGYSLEEALLAVSDNGKRDVCNVLVGFQWTNTVAGYRYGHAVLINGIVDGKVYFVESFDSSLGGTEGTVISCSIKKFADTYDKWTRFEGLIHFGMGTYHDVCPNVSTDLTVQTRFPTSLRSEPAVVGQQDCVLLRSVAAGERLRATGIYESERTYYYRVQTNDGYGFIPAGAVSLVQVNTEGLTISGFELSDELQPGTVPSFAGGVSAAAGSVSSVEVCVTDEQGHMVRRELADAQEGIAQLSDLRDGLFLDLLEQGVYQLDIYASRACPVVVGSSIITYDTRVKLSSHRLYLGVSPRDALQDPVTEQAHKDGWFRENGTWYCYENGKPCIGWVTYLGVRYYLRTDGSAVTGHLTIGGKRMYFSATGALVTGWLTYEGKLYCFGDDGVMLTDTEQTKDGITYLIAKDGIATAKPTEDRKNG